MSHEDAHGWVPIDVPLTKPCMVEIFRPRMPCFKEQPWRDQRIDLYAWTGSEFIEPGTGHDLREWKWHEWGPESEPTHYRVVRPGPVGAPPMEFFKNGDGERDV